MIKFGISILLAERPDWRKQKIALVTNNAATTENDIPSHLALIKAGFNIVKLFSPEHGFNTKGADGEKMPDGFDVATKLPIISLYSEKLKPNATDLADVDLVLFDIPDIGARFYTYLWTLTYLIEACKEYNKPLIILDRPNPIGLDLAQIEGPMLDELNCSSFIGRWDIPLRHSCTLGELALYFNDIKNINASVTVIKCEQLSRSDFFPNWGINFTPTSPAINSFNAAILYPGLGMLEATNLTEGRGTNLSFQMVAAPWLMHASEIQKQLEDVLHIEAITTIPKEAKFAGEICNGLYISPKNYNEFDAVKTGLLLIKLIKDSHPLHFKWQPYLTNANPDGTKHLDKLLGIANSEDLFELPLSDFESTINNLCTVSAFQEKVKPYLLYE
ncbi:exo-beta-N-acetylmuramidase NamZ family protein [Pedobacter boryungensis]|uniref:DUF1343 domain-containing protein n=1 Tax=Pedobacter boryungensis TaxID=869962 RepID=A0ABX2DD44_9SPHI|nr:DUF1343 domain-containing protein [Pedobacter boryungensis]NQX31875.1 DUF1343 domain-containing protein [Pedobacter boryungensis]